MKESLKYRQEMIERFSQQSQIKDFLMKNNLSSSIMDECYLAFYSFYHSVRKCDGCRSLDDCKQLSKGEHVTLYYDQQSLISCIAYCPYYQNYLKEQEYLNNFVYSDIPQRLKSVYLESVTSDDTSGINLIKGLTQILQGRRNTGLYIYGDIGVGKTYLCIALANSLARLGKKVAFVKTDYFVNDMRQMVYNDSLNYSRIITKIKKADYVFFDDIGTETVSSFSRDDLLFTILDYRMENNLTTVFTSNLSKKMLEKHYRIKASDSGEVNSKRFLERVDILADDYVLYGRNKRREL